MGTGTVSLIEHGADKGCGATGTAKRWVVAESGLMAITRDKLIAFLVDRLGVGAGEVDETTPLFSDGLLDSFSMVTLINHLEIESGVEIQPIDVTLANFDSISRILGYLGGNQVTLQAG